MILKTIKTWQKACETKDDLIFNKVVKWVHKFSLLVNIDESVISHNTKFNYSWNRKGVPSNCSTGILKESIGIVSTIMSNGISISCVKKGTINSTSFTEFLQILLKIWERI